MAHNDKGLKPTQSATNREEYLHCAWLKGRGGGRSMKCSEIRREKTDERYSIDYALIACLGYV